MSFACDKLSKLSMMSQQPLHLSKLPTLNISPGAKHKEGESGECLCSLGKIAAYTEDREGALWCGEGAVIQKSTWRNSHFVAVLSGSLSAVWLDCLTRTVVLMTLVILVVIHTSTCRETRKITRSFPINHTLLKYQSSSPFPYWMQPTQQYLDVLLTQIFPFRSTTS